MSTIVVHLAPKPPEIVVDFPDGAKSVSDFPIGAIATRAQIAHLIECARITAKVHRLSECDIASLVTWAEDFFRPMALQAVLSRACADAAREICYAHAGVRLHGQYFRAEQLRLEVSPHAIAVTT